VGYHDHDACEWVACKGLLTPSKICSVLPLWQSLPLCEPFISCCVCYMLQYVVVLSLYKLLQLQTDFCVHVYWNRYSRELVIDLYCHVYCTLCPG